MKDHPGFTVSNPDGHLHKYLNGAFWFLDMDSRWYETGFNPNEIRGKWSNSEPASEPVPVPEEVEVVALKDPIDGEIRFAVKEGVYHKERNLWKQVKVRF